VSPPDDDGATTAPTASDAAGAELFAATGPRPGGRPDGLGGFGPSGCFGFTAPSVDATVLPAETAALGAAASALAATEVVVAAADAAVDVAVDAAAAAAVPSDTDAALLVAPAVAGSAVGFADESPAAPSLLGMTSDGGLGTPLKPPLSLSGVEATVGSGAVAALSALDTDGLELAAGAVVDDGVDAVEAVAPAVVAVTVAAAVAALVGAGLSAVAPTTPLGVTPLGLTGHGDAGLAPTPESDGFGGTDGIADDTLAPDGDAAAAVGVDAVVAADVDVDAAVAGDGDCGADDEGMPGPLEAAAAADATPGDSGDI
jgi:hypothetical protein